MQVLDTSRRAFVLQARSCSTIPCASVSLLLSWFLASSRIPFIQASIDEGKSIKVFLPAGDLSHSVRKGHHANAFPYDGVVVRRGGEKKRSSGKHSCRLQPS
jgi:hypothetical protein